MSEIVAALRAERLLAVVRGRVEATEAVVRTVVTLVEGGIRLVEVSLTTPSATAGIDLARKELGGVGRVGAGTVLGPADARRAKDAGAEFLVTPGLPADLAAVLAIEPDTVVGSLTPSEVVAALAAGAPAVKLFPVDIVGPGYVTALLGPFPNVCLVPVGGVGLGQVEPLLAAGAAAVGVGSPLVGDAADGGSQDALRTRAAAFLRAVGHGG